MCFISLSTDRSGRQAGPGSSPDQALRAAPAQPWPAGLTEKVFPHVRREPPLPSPRSAASRPPAPGPAPSASPRTAGAAARTPRRALALVCRSFPGAAARAARAARQAQPRAHHARCCRRPPARALAGRPRSVARLRHHRRAPPPGSDARSRHLPAWRRRRAAARPRPRPSLSCWRTVRRGRWRRRGRAGLARRRQRGEAAPGCAPAGGTVSGVQYLRRRRVLPEGGVGPGGQSRRRGRGARDGARMAGNPRAVK